MWCVLLELQWTLSGWVYLFFSSSCVCGCLSVSRQESLVWRRQSRWILPEPPTWPHYHITTVMLKTAPVLFPVQYLHKPRKCAMCPNKCLRWGPKLAHELQPNSENKSVSALLTGGSKGRKTLIQSCVIHSETGWWRPVLRNIPPRDLRHMCISCERRSEQDRSVSGTHTWSWAFITH